MGQVRVRGIRGATTVKDNLGEEIRQSTVRLVQEMVRKNRVNLEDISAVFFSVTPDLNHAFPAEAVRKMDESWRAVPLFCSVEIDVPGSLDRCVRVLMLVNTTKEQQEIKHVYLKEARRLREDL